MASKPVFVKSRSDLLARLRLSGSSDQDIQKIVDTEIMAVRVAIYSELGQARVDEILDAGPPTDNPVTPNELTRANAIIMETKWVKARLICELVIYFADDTGGAQQDWNDTGFLRDIGRPDAKELAEALLAEVADSMEQLKTEDPLAKTQVRANSIGPEEGCTARPGGTIWK